MSQVLRRSQRACEKNRGLSKAKTGVEKTEERPEGLVGKQEA